jgi:hypothetical protein
VQGVCVEAGGFPPPRPAARRLPCGPAASRLALQAKAYHGARGSCHTGAAGTTLAEWPTRRPTGRALSAGRAARSLLGQGALGQDAPRRFPWPRANGCLCNPQCHHRS